MDFNELTNQISDLTERLDDNRDKEIIRALKKDIEELKLRQYYYKLLYYKQIFIDLIIKIMK